MPCSLPLRRAETERLLLLVSALVAVCAGGCSTWRGRSGADAVIQSRQLSLRGRDAMEQGDWDMAEKSFEKAIRLCPNDERAHRHFAQVQWRKGDAAGAVHHMQEAVRLSGGAPELQVELGSLHLAMGDAAEAGRCARLAIQSNARLASAWALQGDSQRHAGAAEAALASYQRALNYQPHYPAVQLAAAELYRAAGKHERTLAMLQALAEQYPPGEEPKQIRVLEGLALRSLGRNQQAVETLSLALAQGAADPHALTQLAELLLLEGDLANARLAAQQALSVTPHHPAAARLIAELDARQREVAAVR